MTFKRIFPGLWAAGGGVNVFVIVGDGATVLIDTGMPGASSVLIDALGALPVLTDIVVTHAHYDHAGGAAAVQAATGATVRMHPDDAALLADGRWKRQVVASPTFHGRVGTWVIGASAPATVAPVVHTEPLREGAVLDIAGGIEVFEIPGHSAGQIGLRWRAPAGTVIFAADAVMNLAGLREPLLYEDRATGLASITKLADYSESAVLMVFGHGGALKRPAPKITAFRNRLV